MTGAAETGGTAGARFKSLLESYEAVAVVANSDAVDLSAIVAAMPDRTIYIFTSHSAKVLKKPFDRDSAVVHRMYDRDTHVARRKTLERLFQVLPKSVVKGEFGLYSDFVDAPDKEANAGHRSEAPPPVIDMDATVAGFYPRGRLASTGFVLALWLARNVTASRVYLCGFTGVRGDRLPNSPIHDWTLEQTVLRIFYRTGRLFRFEETGTPSDRLSRLQKRFGPVPDMDLALIACDVVDGRVSGADAQIAHLWSANRLLRGISQGLKSLRPGGAEGKR